MQDPKVPIRFIKSLIKLLNRDSNRAVVERSAFENEGEETSATSPYTVKQL